MTYQYREKIMGGFLGKAAGGTLGQPWEGATGPLTLTYYNPVPTGMIPNDDLDLQVVWAVRLATDWQGRIDRQLFAKAWIENIIFPFDEYGVAIRNLKRGIKPPQCGEYDNFFVNGFGAAIRSEIWACLAPGQPELAAKYAYEDACLDHAGEGIYAEQFLAALESAAFCESNINLLLDKALEYIPHSSRLAEVVVNVRKWCASGTGEDIRVKIMTHYGNDNFTDAVMNFGFIIMALLLGKGDFVKTVTTAANCGQDSDCTAATVGAILGIINPGCIPEAWLAPLGHDLVLNREIIGIEPPKTLDDFVDLLIELRSRITLAPTVIPSADLKKYAIPARQGFWGPFFPRDFRRFHPETPECMRNITLPGSLCSIDFTEQKSTEMKMIEIPFTLTTDKTLRLTVNTPAFVMVWVDGDFKFGRESGSMVPALHRPPINQQVEISLNAGRHVLQIGLLPSSPSMFYASLFFAFGGLDNHYCDETVCFDDAFGGKYDLV